MKTPRPYQAEVIQDAINEMRNSDQPILIMASVGAGKSLIIAEILMLFERLNKRVLCVVSNAELVRNNAATFKEQGGTPSIYCAALGYKDASENIVFGTPQSVLNGIKRQEPIAEIKFSLIVVDEAHMIDYNNDKNAFIRILRHYKQRHDLMRVIGATGTNFRFKGATIVGDDALFKKQIGNITTAWLIENGYLVKPRFEADPEHTIDFTSLKPKSNGQFDNKQLESILQKNTRLTGLIMKQLVNIVESENRFGAFIFASTIRHCYECLEHLPPEQSRVITGGTPQEERIKILDDARAGKIKYLVNVAVLTVGVDVAPFDTVLYVRATESLVLMVQTLGRGLRLADNKTECLVLDCSGNLERHSDWDDPILLDAIKQTRDKDIELPFECFTCNTMNSEHARRCVGIIDNRRCDHYFIFKDCKCGVKNDITARNCRACDAELIDPNAKLTSITSKQGEAVDVLESKYRLTGIRLHAHYKVTNGTNTWFVMESYLPVSEKAKQVFYGQFVKPMVTNSSEYYLHLGKETVLKRMMHNIKTPDKLIIDTNGKIKKRIFKEPCIVQSPDVPTHSLLHKQTCSPELSLLP